MLIFIILFFNSISICQDISLLQSPPSITESAFRALVQATPLTMCWSGYNEHTDTHMRIAFEHSSEKTTLKIQFIGTIPQEICSFNHKFIHATIGGKNVWTYTVPESNIAGENTLPQTTTEVMGAVAQPLCNIRVTPTNISVEQCARLITDKKVTFYTGAGISAQAVPAMRPLMEQLGFYDTKHPRQQFMQVVENILTKPAIYHALMDTFFYACINAHPTPHILQSGILHN